MAGYLPIGGQIFRRCPAFFASYSKCIASNSSEFTVDDLLENHLHEVSSGDGQCVYQFDVAKVHLNRIGNLHGGVTATLVDVVTTFALMHCKRPTIGVSVDLSISYVRPVKEGDVILIEAKTVNSGRTIAFVDAILRRKSDGAVIATGKHTKFVAVGNL